MRVHERQPRELLSLTEEMEGPEAQALFAQGLAKGLHWVSVRALSHLFAPAKILLRFRS